jgi:serine/threonine protein kinase
MHAHGRLCGTATLRILFGMNAHKEGRSRRAVSGVVWVCHVHTRCACVLQGADGVCRLLGTCEKSNRLCLVIKRYERSLADLIKSGPLSAATIRSIGHSLCRTLEQLHRAGVVVQDIKAHNVLLDGFGSPVFADFGIADVIGRTTQIMPTSLKGTSNYMAPEAFEPPFGIEVDVWSMGCLILEMCTGKPPWAELNMQQIITAVVVRKRVPDVPDSAPAAETVRKCFAFGPRERPTASELADALAPQAADVVGSTAQLQLEALTAEFAAYKQAAAAALEAATSRLVESESLVAELTGRISALQAENDALNENFQHEHDGGISVVQTEQPTAVCAPLCPQCMPCIHRST